MVNWLFLASLIIKIIKSNQIKSNQIKSKSQPILMKIGAQLIAWEGNLSLSLVTSSSTPHQKPGNQLNEASIPLVLFGLKLRMNGLFVFDCPVYIQILHKFIGEQFLFILTSQLKKDAWMQRRLIASHFVSEQTARCLLNCYVAKENGEKIDRRCIPESHKNVNRRGKILSRFAIGNVLIGWCRKQIETYVCWLSIITYQSRKSDHLLWKLQKCNYIVSHLIISSSGVNKGFILILCKLEAEIRKRLWSSCSWMKAKKWHFKCFDGRKKNRMIPNRIRGRPKEKERFPEVTIFEFVWKPMSQKKTGFL